MLNQEVIAAEMRLYVLENLVALLWAANHKGGGAPEATTAMIRSQLVEKAQKQTFPAAGDPAISDLYAAELEVAVNRAMAMQESWLGLKPAG